MHRTTILFLILPALLSCFFQEEVNTFQERLDQVLAAELGANGPGGAVLVMKNDEILFSKGYGSANLDTQTPVTPKTLFNLGSISKTFVANGILLLQERGRLSVEDSLFKYFPEISVPEKQVLFVLLANFPCKREKISQQVMEWIEEEHYFE